MRWRRQRAPAAYEARRKHPHTIESKAKIMLDISPKRSTGSAASEGDVVQVPAPMPSLYKQTFDKSAPRGLRRQTHGSWPFPASDDQGWRCAYTEMG